MDLGLTFHASGVHVARRSLGSDEPSLRSTRTHLTAALKAMAGSTDRSDPLLWEWSGRFHGVQVALDPVQDTFESEVEALLHRTRLASTHG